MNIPTAVFMMDVTSAIFGSGCIGYALHGLIGADKSVWLSVGIFCIIAVFKGGK